MHWSLTSNYNKRKAQCNHSCSTDIIQTKIPLQIWEEFQITTLAQGRNKLLKILLNKRIILSLQFYRSKTSARIQFQFLFFVLLIPRVCCTETKQELIFNGTTFQNDLPSQVIVPILLGITIFGFTIQTLMMVYVFVSVLFSSKTTLDILCTLFGTALLLTVRATTVPIIFQTIPFEWAPTFPINLIHICTYVNLAFVTLFSGVSMLACSWFILFVGVTGRKISGTVKDAKSGIEPMVIILMPIYNEEPDALFRAVESAIRSDYPPDRKHIFLAFDDESESALYLSLLGKLKVLSKDVPTGITHNLENEESVVGKSMKMRLEWIVEGVRVTVCRFAHAGKSPTQGKCFKIINEMYGNNSEMAENTFVLFIDSDIILHENSMHNFVVTFANSPKIQGATGLITCTTSRKFNIYQYLQDSEYVDGQMFERTTECVMGAVTCLPGALTLIRLTALQKVARKYFIEFDKRSNVDFHRYHLGEDRYMTYLLVELADHPYQVTFAPCAQCKTYAPDSLKNLLKQRRRWFLGGLTNDIYMLTSPVMWRKTPLMVLFKLYFYSMKGMEWMFGVVIVSLIKSKNPYLFIIFVLLGCRFLLTCVNALLMKRYKICFSNIWLFLVVPFFNLAVLLYSIWTWNIRSWGGPRIEKHNGEDDSEFTP